MKLGDFEPIECEHAVGPSFLLSGTDRQHLERRLGNRGANRGLSVVGLYRSHTRTQLVATLEDIALMSSYFRDSSNLLLLIHACHGQPLTGGFLIWEDRAIRSTRPYLEFPFESGALVIGARAQPAVAPAPPPVMQAEPVHNRPPAAAAARIATNWPAPENEPRIRLVCCRRRPAGGGVHSLPDPSAARPCDERQAAGSAACQNAHSGS